jgi:hypothetical protein
MSVSNIGDSQLVPSNSPKRLSQTSQLSNKVVTEDTVRNENLAVIRNVIDVLNTELGEGRPQLVGTEEFENSSNRRLRLQMKNGNQYDIQKHREGIVPSDRFSIARVPASLASLENIDAVPEDQAQFPDLELKTRYDKDGKRYIIAALNADSEYQFGSVVADHTDLPEDVTSGAKDFEKNILETLLGKRI